MYSNRFEPLTFESYTGQEKRCVWYIKMHTNAPTMTLGIIKCFKTGESQRQQKCSSLHRFDDQCVGEVGWFAS